MKKNSNELLRNASLSTDQILELKVLTSEPEVLYSYCTNPEVEKLLPEIAHYVHPNKIQGVYPFKLQTSVLSESNCFYENQRQVLRDESGLELLDADYLNE